MGLPFRVPPFQPTTSTSSALQNLAPVCKSLFNMAICPAPLNTLFLEATESATAFHGVGQGNAGRSADASPTPHVLHMAPVSSKRLIVNPTLKSGGELGVVRAH